MNSIFQNDIPITIVMNKIYYCIFTKHISYFRISKEFAIFILIYVNSYK